MVNGQRHGFGELISHKGYIISGNFVDGYLTGYGEFIYKNGFKY